MLARFEIGLRRQYLTLQCWRIAGLLVMLLAYAVEPVYAQGSFNSGSTGADGAFNPTVDVTLQVPESGVFNFTTINIPTNVSVTFTPNSRNTPVTILASGNVTIAGYLGVNGKPGYYYFGGAGGPGGFRGGNGGAFEDRIGKPGDGPGGGQGGKILANDYGTGGGGGFLTPGGDSLTGTPSLRGSGGPSYGTKTLLPLIGGSGGGGGAAGIGGFGGGGGGGGGAILIASSGSISFTGNWSGRGIYANANNGAQPWGPAHGGAGASGGSIRIVANTISGDPVLSVVGGLNTNGNQNGSIGYMRAEAFDLSNFNPILLQPSISYGQPNPVTLPNNPQLKIVSVGGVNAPTNPKGSFYQQPDIVVPTTVSNPVTVNLEANNLPVGTVLQVTLTNEAGGRTTFNSTPLAGTQATSTATASITLPTTGIAVISATVTLNVLIAYGKPMFIDGQRIDKVEIAANFGGRSEVTYITAKGERLTWPR